METCKQPNDYFTIEYGFDADVIISAFYSSVPGEMENPEMHGMTWNQVQKTLHKYYSDISKSYTDIAGDWLDKDCKEYFAPPKINSQTEMWADDDTW
jgi:hypothetical protein